MSRKSKHKETMLRILSDGALHSTLEFRNKYIMSVSGVIMLLRRDGHAIETEMLPVNPNDSKSAKIAYYRMSQNKVEGGLSND